MEFDAGSLFLSLVTSAIGFALLTYGRKNARLPQVFGGLALMIYPYFVSSVTAMLVIGALISLAVWLVVRMGW